MHRENIVLVIWVTYLANFFSLFPSWMEIVAIQDFLQLELEFFSVLKY